MAEQVARIYASEGAELFVVGRRPEQLEAISQDLKVRGAASVKAVVADLDDVAGFEPMLAALDAAIGAPDRVLLAYGTLPDQGEAERSAELAVRHIHTNFTSPAVLLNSLAERLRPGAAVAAITSVAGERGRQSNYVYGAAKGGLSRFLEGLRHRLASKGVRVIDIRPGFVDTPMTDGMSKSGPLWAKPEKVARDIHKALEHANGAVHTPWFWAVIMGVITRVPARIFHKTKL